MKKILYIFSVLVLGAVACSREEIVDLDVKRAETVRIDMSMKLPAELLATKAAATEKPVIEDIHVALYGSSGYLQAYTLAKPVTSTGDAGDYPTEADDVLDDEDHEIIYYFQVDLPVYEGLAFVHVIANGPATLPFDGSGSSETNYMSTVSTGYSDSGVLQGAYWDSFVLEDGIVPVKDDNGQIVLTNGHYTPTDATAEAFEGIKLIRNFAQIVVKNNTLDKTNKLTDVSFKIINTPSRGSIAVVDKEEDSGLERIFVEDYEKYQFNTTGNDGYIHTVSGTYYGYASDYPLDESIPASAEAAATDKTFIPLDDSGLASVFVFERPASESKPIYLLIRAKFNDSESSPAPFTYYRVDIKNESIVENTNGNGYIPIYRNYKYHLTINNVGKPGAESPEAASDHDSGGNVSLSVEASKLTDISDGLSRLYVEYIEKNFLTGVDPEGSTPTTVEGTIWAQFAPDATSPHSFENGDITVLGPYAVRENNAEVPAAINGGITIKSTDDNSRVFSFQLNRQTNKDQVSQFRVKAVKGNSTLYRLVTVRVLKLQEMTVSGTPKSASVAGVPVTLNITIDGELPESMFPLQFFIEDSRKTISPTGKDASGNDIEVPVRFDDSKPNSYQYVRTVNIEEYDKLTRVDGKVTVTTMFTTVSEDAYTEVTVSNEYFTDGKYILYGAFEFSEKSFANSALGVGVACPLTISYSREASRFTVLLSNCAPAASETRLTPTGNTPDGYTEYTFTPGSSDRTVTFNLVTTDAVAHPVAEVINPDENNASTGTITGPRPTQFTVAEGEVALNGSANIPSNTIVYVRTSPSANNNRNVVDYFIVYYNQTVNGEFAIDLSDFDSPSSATYVYFNYGNNNNNRRWARTTLGDLIAGNVTLSFQQGTNFPNN